MESAEFCLPCPPLGSRVPLTDADAGMLLGMSRDRELRLYTVGYEGRSVDEFVSVLTSAGVEVLVDVRERALSRKKGSRSVHSARRCVRPESNIDMNRCSAIRRRIENRFGRASPKRVTDTWPI